MNLTKYVDVHSHITDDRYEDVGSVIERAKEAGVEQIICSAYNFYSSLEAIKLSQKYDNVFANVGIHPENTNEIEEDTLILIEELAKEEKVVAIGEIGLDFHREGFNKELQKKYFKSQIELANRVKKPIVVHSREAMGETIEILKNNPVSKESVIHCFSGSVESAKILLELGFSFSIGGVVTFKNAKTLPEVVKFLPIEKILLETDCPYMAPVPFRGKTNEPKNVVYVADEIARLKGMSIENVAFFTTKNAKRIFGI